jgi:protein TonB
VFTKNKGAIDAMYARALRDNPALQGKVVIEMTIAPSGDIPSARIVSSELNDPEFERNCWRASSCSSSKPRMWPP